MKITGVRLDRHTIRYTQKSRSEDRSCGPLGLL